MSKYPWLSLIRTIYSLIGYAIIVGSIILGVQSGQPISNYGYSSFNVSSFLLIVGVGMFIGGSMVIVGEVIAVLVRIEDHLDVMKRQQQQMH